jgi:hypothetical protein
MTDSPEAEFEFWLGFILGFKFECSLERVAMPHDAK